MEEAINQPTSAQLSPSTSCPLQPWTSDEFAGVWTCIPWDVQDILIELGRRPHSYPVKVLRKKLIRPTNFIQGRLSLLNGLIHKKNRDRPRLYDYNLKTRIYSMDLAVASLIRAQPKFSFLE